MRLHMNIKKDGIISGAFILAVCTFLTKLIGAFYRIPLTSLLGSYGLGLYQMVFPVYVLLLDFSGAGLPSAMSRIIASYKGENKQVYAKLCLKKAIKVFVGLASVLCVVVIIFSKILSKLQGDIKAWLGYVFLAPAIIPVCLLSCYRGYFQGLLDMKPTALSQIVEQLIKFVFGLLFVRLFMPNILLAVGGATLSITISEIVAFLILYATYKKKTKNQKDTYQEFNANGILKGLFKVIIPITLTSVIIPLSQVVDSFMLINSISKYSPNATKLYGLLTGVVSSVISLPVSICYGISAVAIPSVSEANQNQKRMRSYKALILTMFFSLLSAIVCFYYAEIIIKILFKNLSVADKIVAQNLLQIMSSIIFFLSIVQTQNAILIGYGKQNIPPITLLLGVCAKIVITLIFVKSSDINVYAGAFGLIACYFLPCLVNLIVISLLKEENENKFVKNWQLASR